MKRFWEEGGRSDRYSNSRTVLVFSGYGVAWCARCLHRTDYTNTTAEDDAISVADSRLKEEHTSSAPTLDIAGAVVAVHLPPAAAISPTETNLSALREKSAPTPFIFVFASPPCLGARLSAESTLDS